MISDTDIKRVKDGLRNNDVIRIVAPPGSGKSTFLVKSLYEELGTTGRIFVCEPTVPAVDSLTLYMKGILGDSAVGSAAERIIHYNKNNQVVYCTSGHLMEKLLSYFRNGQIKTAGINFCTIIMIDEAHNRTIENDTIISLWNIITDVAISSGYKSISRPKLILSSATLDGRGSLFENSPIYQIGTSGYEVKTIYHNRDYTPYDKNLYIDVAKVIIEKHSQNPIPAAANSVNSVNDSKEAKVSGDTWLVFCPGIEEVSTVIRYLNDKKNYTRRNIPSQSSSAKTTEPEAPSSSAKTTEPEVPSSSKITEIEELDEDEASLDSGALEQKSSEGSKEISQNINLEVIPAYSDLPASEREKIFTNPKPGVRKVIVATNIAETSITISNLTGIFDTMTEKYSETSLNGAYRLVLDSISKASSNQRCGRVGRTRPGFCYRMCTPTSFERLVPQRRPEILRIPLHNIIIKIIRTGLDPVVLFKDLLKNESTVEQSRIQSSYTLLKTLGMINQNNRITKMGAFATEFTLSVRSAAVLWHWLKGKLPPFPAVVILSLIDCFGPSYFYYPRDISENDSMTSDIKTYETYFSKFNDEMDLGVLLNIWRDLYQNLPVIDLKLKTLHMITQWSTKNMMNNRKIIEMYRNVYYISNTLKALGYDVIAGPFTNAGCIGHITPLLQKIYADRIFVRANLDHYMLISSIQSREENKDIYSIEERRPLRMRRLTTEPAQIIGLTIFETKSYRGGSSKYISLFHPNKDFSTPKVDEKKTSSEVELEHTRAPRENVSARAPRENVRVPKEDIRARTPKKDVRMSTPGKRVKMEYRPKVNVPSIQALSTSSISSASIPSLSSTPQISTDVEIDESPIKPMVPIEERTKKKNLLYVPKIAEDVQDAGSVGKISATELLNTYLE